MKKLLLALYLIGSGFSFSQLVVTNTTGGPVNVRIYSWDGVNCTAAVPLGNYTIGAAGATVPLPAGHQGAAIKFFNPTWTMEVASETETAMNVAGCPDISDPGNHINWTGVLDVTIQP